MTSITNLIRATDRGYFDLSARSAANVERAGEPRDETLAGLSDPWGLTHDASQQLAIAAEESRDLALRAAVVTGSSDTDDLCGSVWRQVW